MVKPWKPFTEKTGKFITQTEKFQFAHEQTVQKINPKKIPKVFYSRLEHLKKCQVIIPLPSL